MRFKGDALGTATLLVLDDGAFGRARVSLGASRPIRHAVLAVDILVMIGRDVYCVDREVVSAAARHRWGIIQVASNALALNATLRKNISLAARTILAGPATERVAAILAKAASLKAAPVVST